MSIDPIAQGLAVVASERCPSIDLFVNLASHSIDGTVNAIMTGGYSQAGIGAGTYVSDSLATSSMATSYPALCKLSGDGRYWRLLPQAGSITLEQAGGVPDSTGSAIGNANALNVALRYLLDIYDGGRLACGAGTFTFDQATITTASQYIGSGITIWGVRGATTWVSNSPTSGKLLTIASGSDVWLRDLGITGQVLAVSATRGGIEHCTITGALSSQTQYSESAIAVGNYFGVAGQTYDDGAGNIIATPSDFSVSLSGTVLTVTMTGGTLGNSQWFRYVRSAPIPLSSSNRYVVTFAQGFLGMSLAQISLGSGGSGYTTAPNVVITGGQGTGATATAIVSDGVVTGIVLTNSGYGYTSAPTVTFSGGGGTGAAATATVVPAGVGAAPPQIMLFDSSQLAVSAGQGITGPAGAGTATISGGVVTAINVATAGMSYASAPTVTISGGGGSGATATATVGAGGVITGFTVSTGGSGYTSAPTVTLSGGQVDNIFVPNNDAQNSSVTAFIAGAAYIRIAVGGFRSYFSAVGQACSFDFSKINIYSLVNDLAALGTSNSPASSGQVFMSSCADFSVTDNDFAMIAQSGVVMTNCTTCSVERNSMRFVLQGVNDTRGTANKVWQNDIDLRLKTSGGAMIGSRAFRLRGIGGSQTQLGVYSGNIIRGASWGIEILPGNSTWQNTCDENLIDAEFAGCSLTTGDWAVRSNRITLAADGEFGIELPGNTGGPFNNAVAESNIIKWLDFSGYPGFGYSATNIGRIVIKGGYIRAPILVQNVGSGSGGELWITKVDGEYGSSALFTRDCSSYASFGRLRPFILCFPLGTSGSGAVFDMMPSSPANPQMVEADFVVSGAAGIAYIGNSGSVMLRLPYVDASSYRPSDYIRIFWQSAWANARIEIDGLMINPYNGMSSSAWAYCQGTPGTGSQLILKNCKWSSQKLPFPGGLSATPATLQGDVNFTYTEVRSIGTLAAGASTSWTLAVNGAVVGDIYQVQSTTTGGLNGLAITIQATANNTLTVTALNISGASLTPAAGQSLTYTGGRP